MGFRPVFDDGQTVLLRNFHQLVHIHWMSKKMYRHDPLGFGGNQLFQEVEIKVPCSRLTIHWNRHGSAMNNPQG